MKLSIKAEGRWPENRVFVQQSNYTRVTTPELDRAVDEVWNEAVNKGQKLFDGPMCRLERFNATPERFDLGFSLTSYKPFFVLHMARPDLLTSPFAGANPLGLSCALISSDEKLLLGRRNNRVIYYPERIHPFAGSMEPKDGCNLFTTARRELQEELNLHPDQLSSLELLGLIEDAALRQPELVVSVRVNLTATQVRAGLDAAEHVDLVEVPATRMGIMDFLSRETLVTPVCAGAVFLWGRGQWGAGFFPRSVVDFSL